MSSPLSINGSPVSASLTDAHGTFVLLPNVIHVDNIPSVACNEMTLKSGAFFGAFGVIEALDIEPNRHSAFIGYQEAGAAQMAVQRMNTIHGMRVGCLCSYWMLVQRKSLSAEPPCSSDSFPSPLLSSSLQPSERLEAFHVAAEAFRSLSRDHTNLMQTHKENMRGLQQAQSDYCDNLRARMQKMNQQNMQL